MSAGLDIKKALLHEVSASAFRELGDISAKMTEEERKDYETCLQEMAAAYLYMATGPSAEEQAKIAANLRHIETQLAIIEAKLKVKLYNKFTKLIETALTVVLRVAIKAAIGGI